MRKIAVNRLFLFFSSYFWNFLKTAYNNHAEQILTHVTGYMENYSLKLSRP